jgi:DNA-binding XRE family transcriptional regulator
MTPIGRDIKRKMKEEINDRFARLIEELDLNQASFAKKLSVDSGTIHHIVAGRRNKPGTELLAKICITFPDVNIKALLTGDGNLRFKTDSKGAASDEDLEKTMFQTLELKDYTIEIQKEHIKVLNEKIAALEKGGKKQIR